MKHLFSILVLLLALLSSQLSIASGKKYVILYISSETVKIGPYGKMTEYHEKDRFILSQNDVVVFSKPNQTMRIGLIGGGKKEVINVYARDYVNKHYSSLYKYIEDQLLITKGAGTIEENTLFFVNDTIFIPILDEGSYITGRDVQGRMYLPYDGKYGCYVTEKDFKGSGPFHVELYTSKGEFLINCSFEKIE